MMEVTSLNCYTNVIFYTSEPDNDHDKEVAKSGAVHPHAKILPK